jgi:hypothetical protein
VSVDWRRSDDPPDDWKPASAPEVQPGEDPNPLEDVRVSPAGTFLVFFWDTDRDLADDESDVLLRFTPDDGTRNGQDPIGRGEARTSGLFRIDNNEEPIVQLFNDIVITNSDEVRGIPIPFRVIDEEGDQVEVVFHWRHEDEDFPSLDVDGDGTITNHEIDAILADPIQRAEHHVCTEYPRHARGRVVPLDATSVRLTELASGESWILASGLEGRTLELMRSSLRVAPLAATWTENPLVSRRCPSWRRRMASPNSKSPRRSRSIAVALGCSRSRPDPPGDDGWSGWTSEVREHERPSRWASRSPQVRQGSG